MTSLLDTETNFLMSYATGRDVATVSLGLELPPSVRLVIPGFCFMEAFSILETELKRHNRSIDGLESEIRQAERNVVSPLAKDLAGHLQRSVVAIRAVFNDFEARLLQIAETLCDTAVLIDRTSDALRRSLHDPWIDDPTDNLILAAVLVHAGDHPSESKSFLSENRKCFHENLDARAALQSAGVKYFADPSKCLEWLRAQPES